MEPPSFISNLCALTERPSLPSRPVPSRVSLPINPKPGSPFHTDAGVAAKSAVVRSIPIPNRITLFSSLLSRPSLCIRQPLLTMQRPNSAVEGRKGAPADDPTPPLSLLRPWPLCLSDHVIDCEGSRSVPAPRRPPVNWKLAWIGFRFFCSRCGGLFRSSSSSGWMRRERGSREVRRRR